MPNLDKKYVFVLGGSGFVGEAIIKELLSNNFKPILLVRPESRNKIPTSILKEVITIEGDAKNLDLITSKLKEYNIFAFIYLIGLIKEFPNKGIRFIDAHFNWAKKACLIAKELNIDRFLYLSANGTKQNGTLYQTTKYLMEEYLESSSINWTIFKPSIIWDESDKYNFVNVIKGLLKFVFVPLIGGGKFQLAPIHRNDVAKAIAQSVNNSLTFGKKYTLCGKSVFTFKEILNLTARKYHKPIIFIPVPLIFLETVLKILGHFNPLPISFDQLQMLKEGNISSDEQIWYDLNLDRTEIF